jgi:glycosyltransferase involved in cell wall biosynthesis
VIFVGRLEIAQKGLDLLLDAVDRVRGQLPGRVLLVGDGPDRGRIQQEVDRRGLGGLVVLVGRLDGEDKHEALAAAGLLVMPSRFETFGIVAVEALACATPVLAFDIPCLRAVVPPQSGRLVPAFDVEQLAAAMVQMLADPEALAEAGRRGREFARRFDWDEIAEQQAEVYDRVLGRRPVSDELVPSG